MEIKSSKTMKVVSIIILIVGNESQIKLKSLYYFIKITNNQKAHAMGPEGVKALKIPLYTFWTKSFQKAH
jgi:hypothetical protein